MTSTPSRRPPVYAEPRALQITRVTMMRGAYCPPSLEGVTWSPVAGAFVRREPIPDHSITFAQFAWRGAVYVLAAFGAINLLWRF